MNIQKLPPQKLNVLLLLLATVYTIGILILIGISIYRSNAYLKAYEKQLQEIRQEIPELKQSPESPFSSPPGPV